MKNGFVLLAFFCCLCVAVAQPPGGPMDRGPRGAELQAEQLKTYLSLTDQQGTDLQAVQAALREASQPIQEKMREKAQALRNAMEQTTIDQTLVTQLKSEMDVLRQEMQDLRAIYRVRSLAILNDAQRTSLAALEKVLELMASARQAILWNLIEPPEGSMPGVHGGKMTGGRVPHEH